MIYITGDTHGDYDDFSVRIEKCGIGEGDTVIVCGDFGFVWGTPQHNRYLEKLTAYPFNIVFVDGNHENFDMLEEYEETEWNGGKVHKVAVNIYHLMRGQYFEIEGKTFYSFGGAYSIDKSMRSPGRSWWPQELPDNEEYNTGMKNLEKHGYKVDYVLTHTIPQTAVYYLGIVPDYHDSELTGHFDYLYMDKLEFKKWFAGHFHVNRLIRGNLQILYDDVISV